MSGIDGLIVLKLIKEKNKDTIVIMTSGVEDDDIIKEATALGADSYFLKPFNLAELEKLILDLSLRRYLRGPHSRNR
jgi:DNA-binding response OmpR family regulator